MRIEETTWVSPVRSRKAALAAALALGVGGQARADLTVGDMLGNYRVERLVAEYPQGQGFASDLEFYNGTLYSLDYRYGVVRRVDVNTGDITPWLWIKGNTWVTPEGIVDDSLHDIWPFDNPLGLAFYQDDAFMACYSPNTIRRFSTTGPTTQQNPTYVSDVYELTAGPTDLAVTPNGRLYAPIYPQGLIVEFDFLTGQVLRSFPSPHHTTYAMTFDGEDLVMVHSGFADDRVFTRMGLDGVIKEQSHFVHGRGIDGLAYDAETRRIYLSDTGGGIWSAREVPEPGTLTCLTLGAAIIGGRRRRPGCRSRRVRR